MAITRIGMSGIPRALYGSFTGKEDEGVPRSSDLITRLGMYGGARSLYGSFLGKEIEILLPPEEPVEEPIGTFRGKLPSELLREQILREDEEILVMIMAFLETQ